MRIIVILLFIFGLSVPNTSFAELKMYDITVKVEGIKNDIGILAYYYGDKKYIKDTLRFNEKCIANIKGEKEIDPGVYLVVLPSMKNRYFEFIINETNFQIETDTSDFLGKFKSKNSIENKIFYEDQHLVQKVSQEIDALEKKFKELDSTSAEREVLKNQMVEKNNLIKNSRSFVIKNNGQTLYSKVLRVIQDIEIPKDLDSSKVLSYYRNEYLNSIDFSNSGLVRTPVIEGKIKRFLDKHTAPAVDSITRACDMIIERAKANYDFYQYTVNLLINKYAASNIMGHEAVYVHMAEKYYLSGLADWADEATINKLKKRVTAIKPTLIGKVAPEIVMTDINGKLQTLSRFVTQNDFTIIAWWNSTCGHCKKEMPKLRDLYETKLVNEKVGVFAVSTEHQDDEWKKAIEELNLKSFMHVIDLTNTNPAQAWYDVYSTPQILVLDNKGKILAKKISIEDIPGLIEFERKLQSNK